MLVPDLVSRYSFRRLEHRFKTKLPDDREVKLIASPILQTSVRQRTTSQLDPGSLLYHGIKNILRCDQAEVVSGIARYVVSQRRSLRLLAALAERTRGTPVPGFIALAGWLRSFLSVRPGKTSDGAVWIARLGNERGVIEKVIPLVPELGWTELKFRLFPNAAGLSALLRRCGPSRVLRLVRRLHRRYEFFKVLRVVELIGFYSRYLEIFETAHFNLAVMSSHSNPHGIAFNLAARKCGVPVVLITHGMPVRPVARLTFNLAVVHCEAARKIYLEEGCQLDRILVHGRRQHYYPMSDAPLQRPLEVGIFLCKDVNETKLRALTGRLLNHAEISSVLIRPHPKNLWIGLDAWIKSENNPKLRRSSSRSVFDDLKVSDIVLAGNSSVLVDAVTAGRPSAYVKDLDYGSNDMHAFVEHGLIYECNDEVCLDAMLRFYRRSDWPVALRYFANVDQHEHSVAKQTVAAIRELALTL